MRIFSYLFLLVIMMIGLTFASLNAEHVSFNYYFGTQEIALSLLLVFVFGVGIFVGLVFAVVSWLRTKYENIRLKAKLKVVEKEVANLRTLPLTDD